MINDKEGGNCRLFAICKMIMKREALSNISFFHSLNISILLGANQLAWGGLAAMFKVVRLIFFALIVQLRISALFSKKMKGFSLMSLCYRMLKTCFHKG